MQINGLLFDFYFLPVGQLVRDLKRHPEVFTNRFHFCRLAVFQIMQCQWLKSRKALHVGDVSWRVNTGGVQIRPIKKSKAHQIRRVRKWGPFDSVSVAPPDILAIERNFIIVALVASYLFAPIEMATFEIGGIRRRYSVVPVCQCPAARFSEFEVNGSQCRLLLLPLLARFSRQLNLCALCSGLRSDAPGSGGGEQKARAHDRCRSQFCLCHKLQCSVYER